MAWEAVRGGGFRHRQGYDAFNQQSSACDGYFVRDKVKADLVWQ